MCVQTVEGRKTFTIKLENIPSVTEFESWQLPIALVLKCTPRNIIPILWILGLKGWQFRSENSEILPLEELKRIPGGMLYPPDTKYFRKLLLMPKKNSGSYLLHCSYSHCTNCEDNRCCSKKGVPHFKVMV